MPQPLQQNQIWQSINQDTDPVRVLQKGLAFIQGPVALACSFSREDVLLIDLLQHLQAPARIFALDTGRLNEETLELAEMLRLRYPLKIDWYFPESRAVERLEREQGLFSFRESLENRHACCYIRKVEPLQRALKGLAGWISGQRRDQAATRGQLQAIERDGVNGNILKLNPLASWTAKQVDAAVRERKLPLNRLYAQGYRSIGCAPCTRAVQPGEDERAGRWWWESPEHKECGLHRTTSTL